MSNIKSVKFIEDGQTYDLEVDHPDHQFYLSNGVLTSNSHAVLYSLTGIETAYYKAYFPLEFLVANLMSKVGDSNKKTKGNLSKIKEEIKRLDVKIRPPDINNSEMTYKIIDDSTLMTGLDAIKHVGNAIPEILAKRPFSSFADFLTRCDSKLVRADAIQALAASGCLDSFGMPRKMMYFYAADFKKKLQLHLKRKKGNTEPFNYPWPDGETEWTIPELFALEQKYIGEGLTGNKKEVYKGFFSNKAENFSKFIEKYPEISQEDFKKEKYGNSDFYQITGLEGEIKSIFEFTVKKEGKLQGKTMARVTLEDPYGNNMDMVCFPEGLVRLKERMPDINKKCKFEVGAGLKIIATISWYEGDISIIFDDIINCCPPPELPIDLKDKKKVSMKISAKDRDKKEVVDAQVLLEEVEDELIEEGYSDLDEEGVDA
jgi:DNA polymerase III alpha subunit